MNLLRILIVSPPLALLATACTSTPATLPDGAAAPGRCAELLRTHFPNQARRVLETGLPPARVDDRLHTVLLPAATPTARNPAHLPASFASPSRTPAAPPGTSPIPSAPPS